MRAPKALILFILKDLDRVIVPFSYLIIPTLISPRQTREDFAMLEEIMAWLTGAEATLTAAEALADPKEIPNIKALLDDHR